MGWLKNDICDLSVCFKVLQYRTNVQQKYRTFVQLKSTRNLKMPPAAPD